MYGDDGPRQGREQEEASTSDKDRCQRLEVPLPQARPARWERRKTNQGARRCGTVLLALGTHHTMNECGYQHGVQGLDCGQWRGRATRRREGPTSSSQAQQAPKIPLGQGQGRDRERRSGGGKWVGYAEGTKQWN